MYLSIFIFFVSNFIKGDKIILSYLTSLGTEMFEQKMDRC